MTAGGGQGAGARSERGLATVEFVVVFPLLFFCIMAVVQFGIWAHASHVATAAAQEGARAARAEDGSAAAGEARAQALISAAGAAVLVGPHAAASRGTDEVRVEVRARAASVLPGVSLPVRAVAAGPVERYRPEGASP